jgi:phenylalanyl-tRNA synthetase beta chain
VAIAGVMGDATSEVHAGTTDVLLEVAAFDMAAIRRASRRLSLRTEASLRFEKGLPVASLEPAAGRLVQLLQEVAGARPVAIARAGMPAPARAALPLDRANLRGRLGMDIDDAQVDRILRASGCEVSGDTCLAPEFRPDLAIPEDLVEEIGRLHGYEHVQSVAPSMALVAPRANPWVTTARRTRRLLTAHGYDEVYLPVWIGDAEIAQYGLDAGGMVKLINPLAENLCWFRPTSLPHLVEAAVQNRKELDRFAFFEVGKTYARASDGTLVERQHLGALSLGQGDVLAARDLMVALARASGADATVTRTTHPHLHPGRTVSVGGWATVGELHPRLVREHGLREAPVVILADLETLAGLQPALVTFVPPPRFPGMTLDLNVTVPARTEVASVLAAVPGTPDLRQAEVVDVWPLAEGARLTLRFAFNAGDRSLVQDEVVRQMATVRTALEGAGWGVA